MPIDTETSTPAPDPRLRVVHLVLSLNTGGLEMVVRDLVRYSDRDAFRTHVLCIGDIGLLGPQFEALGIPVESLAPTGTGLIRTIPRLVRRLRSLRPHVLHTHNMAPHVQGALAARAAGIPVLIHTKHGRNHPDHRPTILLNRFVSGLTDCVVAVSEDAARVARDIERVSARRVRTIRNGIDLTKFTVPPPRPPRIGRQAVCVARLTSIKDHANILRATRLVVDAEPEFRLEIVGEGPEQPELERLRSQFGLMDHIHFRGLRTDVDRFLADADFFVLSSIGEGISLTLLEAMAMGLPVVTTAVGGNPEVVVHGETGLLVPPRQPEVMADAMLTLISDPRRAKAMGHAGRRRVEEEFDVRDVAKNYENLYREMLGRQRAGCQSPEPVRANSRG